MKKKGKRKRKKGKCLFCDSIHFQSNVICTSHAPTRTKIVSPLRNIPRSRFIYNCLPVGYNFRLGCLQKARNSVLEGEEVECSRYLHAWLDTKKRTVSRHRPWQIKVDTFHRLCSRSRCNANFTLEKNTATNHDTYTCSHQIARQWLLHSKNHEKFKRYRVVN